MQASYSGSAFLSSHALRRNWCRLAVVEKWKTSGSAS